MSGENWTPGPWSVGVTGEEDGSWFEVRGSADSDGWMTVVADMVELQADAHLIAAAPTLYEMAAETSPALRRIAAEMNLGPDDEGRDWYEMLIACADDLDMAMAKARGEV
jgi:hypothetical protein